MDYLQLFQDFAGRSMAERSDAISAIMMQIRNELKIGVLVAFQLGDKGKKMYGGTSVYRDADLILHLEKKKDAVTGQDMEHILQVFVMPSREVGEGMFEVTVSGAHSRVTDIRPKAPDFLMDPNSYTEEIDETRLGLVLAEAESNKGCGRETPTRSYAIVRSGEFKVDLASVVEYNTGEGGIA